MLDDTIAAISTPVGEAGLAIVRLSGPEALQVADRCFEPRGRASLKPSAAPTHTLHYGYVVRDAKKVDEVMVAVMRAPRTYTREDVIEISCHGGILPAKAVLDAMLAAGARLALPGEFTRRAFLNGRLDLAQAEAVLDVIHSRTELAMSVAQEQLAGKLSGRVNAVRDELIRTLAHIEAHIDFPDEDIAPDTREQLRDRLQRGFEFAEQVLRTAQEGQILRRGVRTAIIGRPNVGKSSLLNQLLGHDRAIVSPIPGTTRDTIEEVANVRGLPVIFIDTAGLRDAADEIEVEGIRRSRAAMERADLVLHVIDVTQPLAHEHQSFLAEATARSRIIVLNKIDLPRVLAPFETKDSSIVSVSCATGEGVETLKDAIKSAAWSGQIQGEMLEVMINSRHQDALRRSADALRRTIEAMDANLSLELVAVDLHIAVHALGEIVGKTTSEDLLDAIFSQFCIGK